MTFRPAVFVSRASIWLLALLLGAWLIVTLWLPAHPLSPLHAALEQAWGHFRQKFITVDGQVTSQTYGGAISEGQSYGMLMALRASDATTFDRVWHWTQTHLQRPADHLFGWRWNPPAHTTANATSSAVSIAQPQLDPNNATDADQDIAYALAIAADTWHKPIYKQAAILIIRDLWKTNVIKLGPRYYLTAGTWSGLRSHGVISMAPGYFAPHAYRLFAKLDPIHPWETLAHDGYRWLNACSDMSSSHLPPNWCGIRLEDEQAEFTDAQGPDSRLFSYDAIRVFWRMAQDRQSPDAQSYVEQHPALPHSWATFHDVAGGYNPDGNPRLEIPNTYGRAALFSQWLTQNPPENADEAYGKLLSEQFRVPGYWLKDDNYYLNAVVWLSLSIGEKSW